MDETRATLINRVKNPDDTAAWREFVQLYQPLLQAYVRKRGPGGADADDIVQDVFTRLVPALARFDLDHSKGRFRTWLWQVTQSSLADWGRRKVARAKAERQWAEMERTEGRLPGTPAAAADPASEKEDAEWVQMYRKRILDAALERVKETSQPSSWACFEGRVLKSRPAAEIAEELGATVNSVYINASRILGRVREQCAQYLEEDDDEQFMPF
jgi:RNA polymerase sigma factor (sigma-70 family)